MYTQCDRAYFFLRLHSTTQTLITHAYSHPYEYTYANPIPMSIFEDWAGKSSRLLYLGHFQLFKLKNEVAGLQGKLCLEFISKYSSGFSVKCDEPYVDILGREFLVKRWSISASMPNFETCSVPSILQSGNLHLGDKRDPFFPMIAWMHARVLLGQPWAACVYTKLNLFPTNYIRRSRADGDEKNLFVGN